MPRGRRGRAEDDDDGQAVARVRAALKAHLADGGPGAAVSITYVLDQLDPRGMWQFDPDYRKAMREAPVPDPHRDPLTGARWAGPPGSAPSGELRRVGF